MKDQTQITITTQDENMKDSRYEEALEKVRPLYEKAKKDDCPVWATYEYLFPELKEIEDERIRKNCVHFLELQKAHHADTSEIDDCIAYLEMQKDQKPAERVEINKSLSDAVISELGKYNGENYWKSPWAMDSTGTAYPLYFANLGATWQKEQKPTESPEDIHNRGYIKGVEDAYNNVNEAKVILKRLAKEDPKPAEWSEEDETAYGDLIWCIEQAKKSAKDENDMGNIWFAENWVKNRLKSLRPQPHWKPSYEQINALKVVVHGYPADDLDAIESLLNDLQKLL